MRINYKGADKDFNYRLAEICFDDENEKEVHTMNDIVYLMKMKGGYDIEIVTNGYACCVVEDRDEYEAFVELYKEIKKCCALWRKFGH